MSLIPRYIIKRMVPKDGVKLVEDRIVISVTNVISPWIIDEVPDDVINYLELKVDDKVIMGGEIPDSGKGLEIQFTDTTYTINTLKNALGETFPVGGILTLSYPNTPSIKTGEKHAFQIAIKMDSPIVLNFEREVQ